LGESVLRGSLGISPCLPNSLPRLNWREREDIADVEMLLNRPTPLRNPVKVGRNDPCPCGSRRKYKKCCGA